MKCDNCGNDYARPFQVEMKNQKYNFDSFECAINKLAPRCKACDTRVIGHGVQNGEDIYCCSSCARMKGVTSVDS